MTWSDDEGSVGYDPNWELQKRKEEADRRRDQRKSNPKGLFEMIKVPSDKVGKVIGRGGSQIKDLQYESNTHIKVTKDTEGDDTFVKIVGNEDQIEKAKELINELLVDKRKVDFRKPSTQPSEDSDEDDWSRFPPVKKDFYCEHPEITALHHDEVDQLRESMHNIVCERPFVTENSKPIPRPVTTFEQAFDRYPEILEEMKKAGFSKPTPIQCQAWPILLSGEDMIGISQTGSGKTLAFLLPAFIHIEGQAIPKEQRKGPTVLVVAPTRELALQIDREVKKYHYKGIRSCCIYGGVDKETQIMELKKGVDIVIATPGRMNDLHTTGHLYVKNVTFAVLDEADRMLDMGFEPQIRRVMYSVRPIRQCAMTSATWPPGVRRLAESYTNDPVQVYVGSLDLAATHSVTQVIQMIEEDQKEKFCLDFIDNMDPKDKVIIFCGRKARASDLASECFMRRIPAAALHSDCDQVDRELAIQDISSGTARVLVATDVASRGLDIDDVTHVINFDFPKNIEEYVHRVGRTGRAGKTGESISLFTKNDWGSATELISILTEAEQYVPEELHKMAERYTLKQAQRAKTGYMKPRYSGNNSRW